MNQIVQQYNLSLEQGTRSPPVSPQVVFLYNPGLISSWFFVPGVMGLVLTLIGTLVSAVTVVREKDTGTLEQLLMTPAANWQILLSKIVPLVFLLMGDVILALTLGTVVFNLPFRGSFLLFISLSSMYVFVGISLGIMLATVCLFVVLNNKFYSHLSLLIYQLYKHLGQFLLLKLCLLFSKFYLY